MLPVHTPPFLESCWILRERLSLPGRAGATTGPAATAARATREAAPTAAARATRRAPRAARVAAAVPTRGRDDEDDEAEPADELRRVPQPVHDERALQRLHRTVVRQREVALARGGGPHRTDPEDERDAADHEKPDRGVGLRASAIVGVRARRRDRRGVGRPGGGKPGLGMRTLEIGRDAAGGCADLLDDRAYRSGVIGVAQIPTRVVEDRLSACIGELRAEGIVDLDARLAIVDRDHQHRRAG